jgi:phosphoribosylformylglycinamidine synthase
MIMKARVFIRLKSEVLDPQGQAIESSLKNLNENNIKNIRQGKLIEMDIEAKNVEEARKSIENITVKLLANTVIEDYKIEIE